VVDGVGDHALDRRLLGDIHGDAVGLDAQRPDVFQRLGSLFNAAGGYDDVGPGTGQSHGDAQSDAAVAAGDHGDFTGEVELAEVRHV